MSEDGIRLRDDELEAIRREIADSYDEEWELELDEARLEGESGEGLDRRTYFRELLRLQHELVRLQDWVKNEGLRIVVLFEGRDSAGKGGAIKRITQRLNPRICRVAALPAPSERERTQWYFQRYVSTCRRRARSFCSTARGTTARASSG